MKITIYGWGTRHELLLVPEGAGQLEPSVGGSVGTGVAPAVLGWARRTLKECEPAL
jgi:hypothetical protein